MRLIGKKVYLRFLRAFALVVVLAFFVLAINLAPVSQTVKAQNPCSNIFATTVIQHSGAGTGSVTNLLGAPNVNTVDLDNQGSTKGFVIVGFDFDVINNAGADIRLHLRDFSTINSNGDPEDETFTLYISQNGVNYSPLGSKSPTTPSVGNYVTLDFDIAGTLSSAKFVKIENFYNLSSTINEGPDIDAIEILNSSCSVACFSNTDCGTNGFTGEPFCQNSSEVWKNFTAYTCNNPGTPQASCSSSTTPQLQQACSLNQVCSGGSCVNQNIQCSANSDCGTNGFVGAPYCSGNGVYRDFRTYTCNNPGTPQSSCSNSVTSQLQQSCSSNQTCSGGNCTTNNNPACFSNADCGVNGFIGSSYCTGNAIYRNFRTYICNNPGASNASCSSFTNSQLQQTCFSNQTCSGGSCILNPTCQSNSYRQCVGSAVYWFDSCGNQGSLYQNCSVNQICLANTCVNQNSSVPSSITKQAVNLTSGAINWSNSVNAKPSDVLRFRIVVRAPSDRPLNNATLKDTFPTNLIFEDSLTIGGVFNNSDITRGLSLGTIPAGQTKDVTYQVRVAGEENFAFGTTILRNSAVITFSDSNFNPIASSASVVISRSGVLGITFVPTGLLSGLWNDYPILLILLLFLPILWLYWSGWLTEIFLFFKQLKNKNK